MTYIKTLATYASDLAATFLGFAHDAEESALVLGEDLERICIRTDAFNGRLVQDEDMEQEQRTVWWSIRNAVEFYQKKVGEATVATLKTQVSEIDSFTKKMDSAVRASIRRIKDLIYVFSQLRQRIEHLIT